MSFKMVPKNAEEAYTIRKICQTFRKAALPVWGAAGDITMNNKVSKPLINAPISDIAVIGLLVRLIKGSRKAAKTPRTIVIRYLGYLRTLVKNSPIELAH